MDYIFGIIFDTITRQGVLTLDIKPEYESDIKQLLYENATIIAQGEDGLMINLKRVLHELITDKSIKNRIEEYQELQSKLQNDPNIESLCIIVREMHSQIHGSAILAGYPACDLCDPDKPVDIEPANVTTDA